MLIIEAGGSAYGSADPSGSAVTFRRPPSGDGSGTTKISDSGIVSGATDTPTSCSDVGSVSGSTVGSLSGPDVGSLSGSDVGSLSGSDVGSQTGSGVG